MNESSRETVRAAMDPQHVPHDERRQSPRYRLREARAVMSWEQGAEHFTCKADVLNISGGGAAVLAQRAPPLGVSVRLEFECNPAAMEAVEARSLATAVDPSGRQLVRFQFSHWVSLDAILEHHQERRLWQRFPVDEKRAKLTWIDDGSEKSIRGELSNISGGGAAIIVDVALPTDEPIWFELETGGQ